jgi:hypothetical protein
MGDIKAGIFTIALIEYFEKNSEQLQNSKLIHPTT